MSMEIEKDWTTKAGLRAICVLNRGTHRCGYVCVPKDHILNGIRYNQAIPESPIEPGAYSAPTPELELNVHGGLTYSGSGHPTPGNDWWFGFDCAHAGDGIILPTYNPFRDETFGRGDPVRSQEYVESECESLAQQLVDYNIKNRK